MKAIQLTESLYGYIIDHTPALHPVLADLRAETAKLPGAQMQIAPDQGVLMNFLAKLIGARRAVEVGCFTGYSAIAVALALPSDGKLVTIDVDPTTQKIAKRYFAAAGVDGRIDARLGNALEELPKLEKEFGPGSFDMAFIDADKKPMVEYYELCLRLVRKGGLILADNVLWSGGVADPSDTTENTAAVRRFNAHVRADERCDRLLLNVSDGIFALRRR